MGDEGCNRSASDATLEPGSGRSLAAPIVVTRGRRAAIVVARAVVALALAVVTLVVAAVAARGKDRARVRLCQVLVKERGGGLTSRGPRSDGPRNGAVAARARRSDGRRSATAAAHGPRSAAHGPRN